jgi:hypothetical protein
MHWQLSICLRHLIHTINLLHPKGVHASSIIVFLPQIHFSNLSLLRYRKQICFYNYYYRTFFLSLKVLQARLSKWSFNNGSVTFVCRWQNGKDSSCCLIVVNEVEAFVQFLYQRKLMSSWIFNDLIKNELAAISLYHIMKACSTCYGYKYIQLRNCTVSSPVCFWYHLITLWCHFYLLTYPYLLWRLI